MSIAVDLGRTLAAMFQPVTPLLSLTFAGVLFWRQLNAYWAVATYFLIASIHGTLSYFYNVDTNPAIYVALTAIELTFIAIIAWQLGRRSFVGYPSLAAFATRALWILLPICLILAFVTMLTDPPQAGRHPALQLTVAIERSAKTAILVFLLAIAGFAGWFPVRMKQNSARLLIGFLVLQACEWIVLLAANTNWQWTWWGSFWKVFVSAEVLIYWLIALNPAGEVAVASTVPRWDAQRMSVLSGQLDYIQAQLSRRGY